MKQKTILDIAQVFTLVLAFGVTLVSWALTFLLPAVLLYLVYHLVFGS
jgi:hypothetical protein